MISYLPEDILQKSSIIPHIALRIIAVSAIRIKVRTFPYAMPEVFESSATLKFFWKGSRFIARQR